MASCVTSSGEVISIDALEAELSIFLPKVASPISHAALMRSIMSVVDKAKLLRYKITQDYYNGVTGYPVEIPGCSSVLLVDEVKVSGTPVEFEVLNGNWVELESNDSYQPPEVCQSVDNCQSSADVVRDGLEMDVYGGISKDACDIPLHIYERYGMIIINGALSILYGMQDEEWYSPEMVRFYGGIAKQGVSDIKQDTFDQVTPDGIPLSAAGGLIV